MKRRGLLLAGVALVAPRITLAQARKVRVGMLLATSAGSTIHLRAAFVSRLAQLGWRDRENIEYVVRYAEGDPANYQPLAIDMVSRRPDLIFVGFGPFAAIVKQHTKDIPIVFTISQDPVGDGLVASLARPGGNATGTSTRNNELVGKRLELIKEVLPPARRIGVIRRTGIKYLAEARVLDEDLRKAASVFGMEVIEAEHPNAMGGNYASAFAQLVARRVDVVASVVNWNYLNYREFARDALQARLPTVCDATEFAEAGCLLSFSIDRTERYRKSAEYVDRILRGARPADLPVQEPTQFELVANLGTAKALGMKIPASVLVRADRVIG
jgi:putative ABC transport system substrate-binding protein